MGPCFIYTPSLLWICYVERPPLQVEVKCEKKKKQGARKSAPRIAKHNKQHNKEEGGARRPEGTWKFLVARGGGRYGANPAISGPLCGKFRSWQRTSQPIP